MTLSAPLLLKPSPRWPIRAVRAEGIERLLPVDLGVHLFQLDGQIFCRSIRG
jgi:hypothetical protein